MRVTVKFTNDERTEALIVVEPSWFARLFGARAHAGEAARINGHWVWSTTLRHIDHTDNGSAIIRELELQAVDSWVVESELPRAEARYLVDAEAGK